MINLADVFSVNPYYIVILLAVGFVLKHFIKDLNNEIIPVMLIILGVVIGIIFVLPVASGQEALEGCVCGICSAATAIGIHSGGKTIAFLSGGGKTDNVDEDLDK